ncbi:MAG: hypothetical protein ABI624_17640 [Casimicrobiaceae bacterium]
MLAAALKVEHSDALGNDQRVANRFIGAGSLGFAAPVAPGIVAGIGLFAQGGAGNVYKDVRTPFGTRDDLTAQLGFAKRAPAIAWQVTDDLAVAVSVPVAAIVAKQRIFPNTSVHDPANPARSFFGLDLRDARGAGVGIKVGVLWHASPALAVGVTWANRIGLTAEHGKAEVNMTSAGLGVVRYASARLEGFALAP